MAEATSETTADRKLHEIFEEAFDSYDSFETCNDPTNSPEFQVSFLRSLHFIREEIYSMSLTSKPTISIFFCYFIK